MSSERIASWAEHDGALHKILLLVSTSLHIFDDDLLKLKLERRETAEKLQRFLAADRKNSLRIVLRNAEPLRRESPRLTSLLATFPQQVSILECTAQLAPANDSLCLADRRHALVRFNRDQARSTMILDSAQECAPYEHQFEAILSQGGKQISATTLGL